jgi:hypothetical protein
MGKPERIFLLFSKVTIRAMPFIGGHYPSVAAVEMGAQPWMLSNSGPSVTIKIGPQLKT